MADENNATDIPLDSSPDESHCDESKCLSTGLMPANGSGTAATSNPLLFNCYALGPGTLYPYLCADDYVGVRISNNDVLTSTDSDVHYYTCCPPDENDNIDDESNSDNEKAPPVQECEDPQESDPAEISSKDWTPTTACQAISPSYPYGRYTTQLPGFPEAYMCCSVDNSPPTRPMMVIAVGDAGIREDIPGTGKLPSPVSSNSSREPNECYPFLFCDSCVVENNFVDLQVMNCYNDVYQYPDIISMSGNTATYRCCSVPQVTDSTSSFVLTSTAYVATVWTQFTLALIASLMASLLIVSIGRSLYLATNNPVPNTTWRGVSGSYYSAYNIYLLLQAIPDLAYNLFMLGIVTETFNNGWIPENDVLITLCATINQYMNAIIARELLDLLLRTKACQPYVPPSFKKAWIQFGIVTTYATALGVLWLYLLHYSTSTSLERAVRATVAIPLQGYSIAFFYALVVILPAIYLLWVCFEIWYKQLLPKSEVAIGSEDFRTRPPSNITNRTTITTTTTTTSTDNSLKNFRTFGTGLSSRFISATSGTVDCRDETNNTSSSNRPYSRRSITNEVTVSPDGNTSRYGTTTRTTSMTTTPTAVTKERLNVLAMTFLRIILVFFFLWLPGMIMYYIGYQPNRNASGLLHNLGLIFLSLQAIVSNGMALIKPDVKKSIHELWDEVAKICYCVCCCQKRNEDGNGNGASQTAPASSWKLPEKWADYEEDVEVPIRDPEEHSERPSEGTSNQSFSNIMTVESTNIGGIEVVQLRTHSISSFNSGDSDGDSDSDDEYNVSTAIDASPRAVRKLNILNPEGSSHSQDDKDTKTEKKKKKKSKTNENKSIDDCASGRSGRSSGGAQKRRNSQRRGDRSNGNSRTASPSSLKAKKKKRSSDSHVHVSDSPVGEPKRRSSLNDIDERKSHVGQPKKKSSRNSKSPVGQRNHSRRNSVNDIDLSKSPVAQQKKRSSHSRNSKSPVGRRNHSRRNSVNDIDLSKSPVGRRNHSRRNSVNDIDLNKSPVAQPKKRSSRNSKSPVGQRKHNRRNSLNDIDVSKSPVGQRRKKRLSGSHLHARDSYIVQAKKKSSRDTIDVSKSPVVQAKKKSSRDTIDGSKSPVAQAKKKSSRKNIDVSKSPVVRVKKKSSRKNIDASKSPATQRKNIKVTALIEDIEDRKKVPESPPLSSKKELRVIDSPIGVPRKTIMKRRGSTEDIQAMNETYIGQEIYVSDSDVGQPKKKRTSGNSSHHVSDSAVGQPKKKRSSGISIHYVSDSAMGQPSTKQKKKKRISSSKGISHTGTVTDH